MSEAKNTPWIASGIRVLLGDSEERYLQVLGSDNQAVAYIPYGNGSSKDHTEAHAAQRVMAAAPDLVEALTAIVLKARAEKSMNGPEWTGLGQKAIDALGKAGYRP